MRRNTICDSPRIHQEDYCLTAPSMENMRGVRGLVDVVADAVMEAAEEETKGIVGRPRPKHSLAKSFGSLYTIKVVG